MAQLTQQQRASAINTAALSVALEHPALSSSSQVLCAAARTCKAWRQAVQQCKACNTAVEVCLEAPLSQLCSFARWLPKHAALVKSITISSPSTQDKVCGLLHELHLEAAQQLLQQALQLATALPAAAAAAAAAAPPPPPARAAQQNTAAMRQAQQLLQQPWQQQQQQRLVRLPAISSITMEGSAGMLAALPAHSLTHLHIERLEWPCDDGAVSAALMRLSNLQQLHLGAVSCGCLASLSQLTQLTFLKLKACMQEPALRQLLAQPLPLRVLRLTYAYWTSSLDVSHWTQLQEFSIDDEFCKIILPPQLQKLEAGYLDKAEEFQGVLQLQQLRCLAFQDNIGEPELLLRLAKLPALQQLSLRYYNFDRAAETAAAWPQLPQLRELEVGFDDLPSRQQWQAVCSGLAACSSLTKLELEVAVGREAGQEQGDGHDDDEAADVEMCAQLAGLKNLQELSLADSCLVPGDALALTALTGLTKLNLGNVRAGVGDVAATAIASSCQQLRHLDLSSCDLGSMVCLAVVRRLTQLTELQLEGNSGLTQQGLMLLTGVMRLQHLGATRNSKVTDQVVQRFWAALRQQQL